MSTDQRFDAQLGMSSSIRERDAEWEPIPGGRNEWRRDVTNRTTVAELYGAAIGDRRTLLAALDALVEAAEELADEMTDHGDPLAAEFGRALRAALAAAKEASDG